VNYVGKVIRAGFAATLSANQAGGRPPWRATKRLPIVEPPPAQNLRSGAANVAGGPSPEAAPIDISSACARRAPGWWAVIAAEARRRSPFNLTTGTATGATPSRAQSGLA